MMNVIIQTILLGCPKVLRHTQRYRKKWVRRTQMEDFQKLKRKHPIDFTSVPNFNIFGPFLTSLGCLKVLEKNGS